jgi:hypothetical protein
MNLSRQQQLYHLSRSLSRWTSSRISFSESLFNKQTKLRVKFVLEVTIPTWWSMELILKSNGMIFLIPTYGNSQSMMASMVEKTFGMEILPTVLKSIHLHPWSTFLRVCSKRLLLFGWKIRVLNTHFAPIICVMLLEHAIQYL